MVVKIAITGGPCAGKTTAISRIKESISDYTILYISETATELISSGVAPWTCKSRAEYQKCQMLLQLAKEDVYCQAADAMPKDKILIVCDRGILDNKAYMPEADYQQILTDLGRSESELYDMYDAVFFLDTAAKGAEEAYTLANNTARTESPEEAIKVNERVYEAWKGHPYFRCIDNTGGFETKMKKLMREIRTFLSRIDAISHTEGD